MSDREARRDYVIDAVYKALVQYDRAKRTARDLRMISRGEGPTIKRGTGRAAQAILVTDAVLAAWDEWEAL